MTRTNVLACGLCLILVGVAPAVADTNAKAPSSLQMRSRSQLPAHRVPTKLGKQVAQAPGPDQPPPDGDQPPGAKEAAPPAPAPPDQTPAAKQEPAPAQ